MADFLSHPTAQTYLKAIAEVARVGGRVGAAVHCHAPWLEPLQARLLQARCEEVKAQYSVAISTVQPAAAQLVEPLVLEVRSANTLLPLHFAAANLSSF